MRSRKKVQIKKRKGKASVRKKRKQSSRPSVQAVRPRVVETKNNWKPSAVFMVSILTVAIIILYFSQFKALVQYVSESDGDQVPAEIPQYDSEPVSSSTIATQVQFKAAERIEPSVVLPEVSRGDASRNQIIFTFDGGSVDVSGQKILDALESRGLRGTFFLTGEFIKTNPELARRMATNGHEIYNHTFTHPYLTQLGDQEIREQFRMTEDALQEIAGVSTKPFFRPSFGDRDERVLKIAAEEGYRSVYWSFDAGDWREAEGISSEQVRTKIMSNLYPGAIILMHIGDTITGEILGNVIDEIQTKGYSVVSLREGL